MSWNAFRSLFHGVVCLCCLLLTASVAVAQKIVPDVFAENKTAVLMPFEYFPPSAQDVIIQVSINGEPPLPFLFDTGTGFPITLSPMGAKKLNIHPTANDQKVDNIAFVPIKSVSFPIRTADGKKKDVLRIQDKGAKVAFIDAPAFWEAHKASPIAGIIGVAFFEQGVVQLDFAAKIIRISVKPHKPLRIAGATMLPMRTDEEHHYYVSLQPQTGKPVSFMLDTGAQGTEAPREAAVRFHSKATYVTNDVMGVDGQQEMREALLPSLAIGNLIEPDVRIAYSEDKKVAGESIIGMNLLTRFCLTFDFANKQVFFQRGVDYKERTRPEAYQEYDINEREGKYYIGDVEKGYSADRANVTEGDRIVEVDGVPLTGLPLYRVKNLVFGYADTTAHLVLERKGERKEVSYYRYGLKSLLVYPPSGVGIQVRNDDPLQILVGVVRKGSPAEEAAISAGDTITKINGKPTSELCFEAIVMALNAPEGAEVALEIQPKGQTTMRTVTLKSRILALTVKQTK